LKKGGRNTHSKILKRVKKPTNGQDIIVKGARPAEKLTIRIPGAWRVMWGLVFIPSRENTRERGFDP